MTLSGNRASVDGEPPLLPGARTALAWLKQRPGDFVVEEVPAYPLADTGTHLWLQVFKRGLTTRALIERLARALDRPARAFGIAGLKDARADTLQWVTIEHPPADWEARLAAAEGALQPQGPHWRVRAARWHRTRLKRGQSHGNRFQVRLRGLSTQQRAAAPARLEELVRRGAPNAYGPQRFGHRGDTAAAGAALVAGDATRFLDVVLGSPRPGLDTGTILVAREAYAADDLEAARGAWPRDHAFERRLLGALAGGRPPEDVLAGADPRDLPFYLHAWQSAGFNAVLAARLAADRLALEDGDLALRLPGGRKSFEVPEASLEQARAQALEIAPTGPLLGPDMPSPSGAVGELESEVLARSGLGSTAALPPALARTAPGGRRALLAKVMDAGVSEQEEVLELRFHLAKGCYATSIVCALRLDEVNG